MKRWLPLLILSVCLSLLVSSNGLAKNDTRKKLADYQKKLNAEILAEPFSVPSLKEVQPKTESPQTRQSTSRRDRYRPWYAPSYFGLGWNYHHGHYGHHLYGHHGWYNRHYW